MIAGTYEVDDHDMFVIFQIAYRARQHSGLARHERQALRNVFERLSDADRSDITRCLGTDFVESFTKGEEKE